MQDLKTEDAFELEIEAQSIESELGIIERDMHVLPTRYGILQDAEEELFTVQDMVRYLVSLFAGYEVYVGHGTDNYWDEALEIVQAVMRLSPPCDDSVLSARLTLRERRLIAKMAWARVRYRLPTPYLTRRAFFAGLQFYVDKRVIVPRSPFAELIERRFEGLIKRDPERVLDMCTGSGCIAIAIAMKFEGECEVDAVDISADALEVAERNIEAYELEDRVFPIRSDLFDALPAGDRYDLIVANPPYVDAYDLRTMPKEYSREPEIALGSGEDGLDCTRRILARAADFLTDDGMLIVEVGNSMENLKEAYPDVPFTEVALNNGGHGVFAMSATELRKHAAAFRESR